MVYKVMAYKCSSLLSLHKKYLFKFHICSVFKFLEVFNAKVTHAQVWGIGCGHLWRAIMLPTIPPIQLLWDHQQQ